MNANRATVPIDDSLEIPEDELIFRATRGGGPGGQHVNKVSTRITLLFDVDGSPSLDTAQKDVLRRRLATRISAAGVLRVVCGASRSQAANRQEAVERFAALLRAALRPRKRRSPTRVPAGQRRRRLEVKRRRSRLKRARTDAGDDRD